MSGGVTRSGDYCNLSTSQAEAVDALLVGGASLTGAFVGWGRGWGRSTVLATVDAVMDGRLPWPGYTPPTRHARPPVTAPPGPCAGCAASTHDAARARVELARAHELLIALEARLDRARLEIEHYESTRRSA